MRLLLVMIALLAASTNALSVPAVCEDREYVRLKDKASTEFGRKSLAKDYCDMSKAINDAMANGNVATVSQCNRARSKLGDVLSASKDEATFAYAVNDCKREYNLKTKAGRAETQWRPINKSTSAK
jgi:hypothetical protein